MKEIIQGLLPFLAIGGIVYWILRYSRKNNASQSTDSQPTEEMPAAPEVNSGDAVGDAVGETVSGDDAQEAAETYIAEPVTRALDDEIDHEIVDTPSWDDVEPSQSPPVSAAAEPDESMSDETIDDPESERIEVLDDVGTSPSSPDIEHDLETPDSSIPDLDESNVPAANLNIDEALADEADFVGSSTPPSQSTAAVPPPKPVPPKRQTTQPMGNSFSADSQTSKPVVAEAVSPTSQQRGGAIPPRRYAVGEQPSGPRATAVPFTAAHAPPSTLTTPPPASEQEPVAAPSTPTAESLDSAVHETEAPDTISLTEAQDTSAIGFESYELDDLRLALEASQNELSHLTSQRDQAVSRTRQQEQELDQLRQRLDELAVAQEAVQQERQRTQQLESELNDVRSQLDDSRSSADLRQRDEERHQSTLDELRMLLAEREAMEASLSRERDNLVAQNEDLQRRVDAFSGADTDSAGVAAEAMDALTQQKQQLAAELSLANETVRQLNQNITQRDAQMISLRQQVESLTQEVNGVREQAELQQSNAVQEAVEARDKVLDELRSELADRNASIADLQARQAEQEAAANEFAAAQADAAEQAQELSLANESIRQLNESMAEREAELATQREQVNTLTQELEDVHRQAAEQREAALREIEQQHESATGQWKQAIADRDAMLAEQTSRCAELEAQLAELPADTGDSSLAGELSLANESIRQLNQNISHRDAELMNLRQQVQSLTQQVEEGQIDTQQNDVTEDGVAASETALREMEEQHAAALRELRQIVADRDATIGEQSTRMTELEAQIAELSATGLTTESDSDSAESDSDSAESDSGSAESDYSLATETIRELNQTLLQRDAELIQLRRERKVEQQPAASPGLEEELDRVRRELEEAQNSCAELEAERNRQTNEFASAKETLYEQLAAEKTAHQSTTDELEVADTRVSEQASVIEQLRDERTSLQHQLTKAKQEDAADIERVTAERDEAIQRCEQLQVDFAHATKPADDEAGELAALRETLESKSGDFDALQAKYHTLKVRFESENGKLQSRLESLQSELQQALTAAADAEAIVASQEAEQASTGEDRQAESAQIADLESTIEEHQQITASLQAERQDLLDQLGASQEEINAKAAEMRKMREELKSAQHQAQQSLQQQQAFEDLQLAEKQLKEEAAGRGVELKRLQDEQIELKQQVAHFIDAEEGWRQERIALLAQAGFDENGEPLEDSPATGSPESEQAYEQQIKQLELTLSERDAAISSLTDRFAELKQMYESAVDRESVLDDDASDPLDAMRGERDQAAAAAAEASATIAELMSELHQLKSQAPDAAAKLEQLEDENREYRRSVAELHAALNELEEMKLDRVREQESARQKLQEAVRANAELGAELEELKSQPESSEQLEAQAAANETLVQEVAELKQQINRLQRERSETQDKLRTVQEKLDATPQGQKEGAQAIREVKRLQSKLESQERKLQTRDDRLQTLASDLGKLRAEAASLKSELAEQQAVARAQFKGLSPVSLQNGEPKGRSAATRERTKKKSAKTVKRSETNKAKSKRGTKTVKTNSSSPDDLKLISGIGPALEKRLNSAGIYRFAQVKAWSKANIEQLNEELSLGGRITRDQWVSQAKELDAS